MPKTESISALVMEKLPFILLSAAMSVIAFLAQSERGAVVPLERMDLIFRLKNVSASYIDYLVQTVIPTHLAIFYSLTDVTWPRALASTAALMALTVLVVRYARRRPLMAFGWFWYLVTLLPVIGLVQIGLQSRADRYTYIPLVGVLLVLVEIGRAIGQKWPGSIRWVFLSSGLVLLALGFLTSRQVEVWKNSETLFRHALRVTKPSHVAHNNLGAALAQQDRHVEAIEHFREAVNIMPSDYSYLSNIGYSLMKLGKVEEATQTLARALEKPHRKYEQTQTVMAEALLLLGQTDNALRYYSKVKGYSPDSVEAQMFMGEAFLRNRRYEQALVCFEKARHMAPARADVPYNMGLALAGLEKYRDALNQARMSLAIEPNAADVRKFIELLTPLAGQPPLP